MRIAKNLITIEVIQPIVSVVVLTALITLLLPLRSAGHKAFARISKTPLASITTPVLEPALPITDAAPQPEIPEPTAKNTVWVTATSYNSDPAQTDDTPFITASGSRTRDGVIAANFLPFGTKVRFPEEFGDKIFVVEDRMHPRYKQRVDIWHAEKQFSLNFGVRRLKMEVL